MPRSREVAYITERERQVGLLICEGAQEKTVATKLHIGLRTVKAHRVNLYAKYNLHNIVDLIRLFIEQGFITIPSHECSLGVKGCTIHHEESNA